jgi:protein-S-isoprenylcysteine O-methyltransferase Ste14
LIPPAISTLLPHDWPALAVGLIVAAYWFRVMRMAAKMRRKTGNAANLVPAEPLGRALRIIWQPVVWTWIACPLFTAWNSNSRASLLRPIYDIPLLQWLAVAVAILAYAATRLCWKRMGKSWRMGIDPAEKTSLVFTGPYAFVRHPIYALSSALMVATVAAVPSPLMMIAAALHLLLLQWEARREEQNLCRIHGRQYEDYRSRTGRFIPRLRRGYTPSPSTP